MCSPGGLVKARSGPGGDLGDNFLALGFAQNRGTDTLIKPALSRPADTLISSVEKIARCCSFSKTARRSATAMASADADAAALTVCKNFGDFAGEDLAQLGAKLGTVDRTAMLAGGRAVKLYALALFQPSCKLEKLFC